MSNSVRPGQSHPSLAPLNRTATGSRNGPGADIEGLNLFIPLKLHLDR